MDSERQIEIPPLIRRAAQQTVRGNETIEAVLLFGSRARGDHTSESDYDIAIVTGPRFERPPETAMALCDPDLEKKFGTQLVFVSREGLERDANTAGTLASRIAREGAIIAGDWRRPQCRDGNELDIDTGKALAWAEAMSLKGAWACGWLQISSLEEWDGDNAAAMAVHLMAEHVANAPAHRLFERVRVARVLDGETVDLGGPRARELAPARAYADYAVEVDVDDLTRTVAVLDRL